MQPSDDKKLILPPGDTSLLVKRENYMLEFFAYETIGCVPHDLSALVKKLTSATDCVPYLSEQGVDYTVPPGEGRGYTVIEVLEFLKGLELNNLVMAYVHSLRPSKVRITHGVMTCDAYRWRVTVDVREREGRLFVEKITQEVEVLYSSGDDVGRILRAVKEGKEPPATSSGGCFGYTKGLERVDFS